MNFVDESIDPNVILPTINWRKLRGQLAEHEMTYKDFGKVAGITADHLSSVMHGRVPLRAATAFRIEKACEALKFEGVIKYELAEEFFSQPA